MFVCKHSPVLQQQVKFWLLCESECRFCLRLYWTGHILLIIFTLPLTFEYSIRIMGIFFCAWHCVVCLYAVWYMCTYITQGVTCQKTTAILLTTNRTCHAYSNLLGCYDMLTGKYSVTGIIKDGNVFVFRVKQYKSKHHKKLRGLQPSVTQIWESHISH